MVRLADVVANYWVLAMTFCTRLMVSNIYHSPKPFEGAALGILVIAAF
jgi:hypothetical protein